MCILLELTVSLSFTTLRVLYAHSDGYSAFIFTAGQCAIIWIYYNIWIHQHLFIRHPPLMCVQVTHAFLAVTIHSATVVICVHTFLSVYEQGFL